MPSSLASVGRSELPHIANVMCSILFSADLFLEIQQQLKFQHSQMIKHNNKEK